MTRGQPLIRLKEVHATLLAEHQHTGPAALVARSVTDLVVGSGVEFTDRGEHDLKGVPGVWKLYRVLS